MGILRFSNDHNWDAPFFKRLSRNDTGHTGGHQSGIVIPQGLRNFFPRLLAKFTKSEPTIDFKIDCILYLEELEIGQITTRYQYQSWGGTRTPESRLTGNLTQLLNQADQDDLLVFQRSTRKLNEYTLRLVKQNSKIFKLLSEHLPHTRWGVIGGILPVTQEELNAAENEVIDSESKSFLLFSEQSDTFLSQTKRIARNYAFREHVLSLYNNTCSVCKTGLITTNRTFEVDAAHIVPKRYKGTDDARNGIALCKRHHWAFDNGLFGIDNKRKVVVPSIVLSIKENQILNEINGTFIMNANDSKRQVHDEALKWHLTHIVKI